MVKKSKSNILTLTLESKVPNLGDTYSRLETYSKFFTHLERDLFNTLASKDKLDSDFRKTIKREFSAKNRIQVRIFNALWVQAKGKLDSFNEINKRLEFSFSSKIKDLKAKVNKIEKEIKQGKRKHGKGFIILKPHEIRGKKQVLSFLKIKLDKLLTKTVDNSYTFGSRKLFKEQFTNEKYIQDHELWLETWRTKRNNYMFFIGSKDESNGNQLCQFNRDERTKLETLSLTVPQALLKELGSKVEIPVKFSSHLESKNGRYYKYFNEALEQGVALSYKIFKRVNGSWYSQVSFSLEKNNQEYKQGYLGVDVNYNLLATAECDSKGNYLGFKDYHYESENKSTNQIKNEISLIVNDIVERAKGSYKSIVIENLDFTKLKSKSRGKKTNRKLNLIQYSIFKQLISSRCLKNGVRLKIVNPAYSSIIGINKYSKRYGVSTHTSAGYVLSRRGFFGIKERLPSKMIVVLRGGEADKFEKIYRHRHHWSHWIYLSKNLEKCLKAFNKAFDSSEGFAFTMNLLRTRFNPSERSFLARSCLKCHDFNERLLLCFVCR